MLATFTKTCRTATGSVAGHWSNTRGGASSSPSMGFQVATAWGWLESGYGIVRQTVMGANHGKGGWQGGEGADTRLTQSFWHSALLYPPLSLSLGTR